MSFSPHYVYIFLLPCRSPLEWLTNRWIVKARTTGADWVITLSPGASTGPELAFPSGTTTRKNYWAHQKPGGSASTWTSTQGFCPFTEWPKTRWIWYTSTSTSSLVRYTLVLGSGLEPELLWQFASWTDVGKKKWWGSNLLVYFHNVLFETLIKKEQISQLKSLCWGKWFKKVSGSYI